MAYRRLGVKSGHRKAMLRNMTTSLMKYGRIETTEARAKELKSVADKMITLGKKGDLASRRAALGYIMEEDVVTKVFTEYADKYKDRQGGYTRILRLDNRRGDAAKMCIVELV